MATPTQTTNADVIYINALKEVLEKGEITDTRNSRTTRYFGIRMEFDVSTYFPLLTTKKMYWKGIAQELLWFIRGSTNSKELEKVGVSIWKGNSSRAFLDARGLTYEEGECGPIYGFQWRHWGGAYKKRNRKLIVGGDEEDGEGDNGENNAGGGAGTIGGIDQLAEIIHLIKTDPFSRRIFMSAWAPHDMDKMCLPPCHISYQFFVDNEGGLSCQMYQRSGDMFLGIPFNIASGSLLLYMIAHITGLRPKRFLLCVGDAHIYENHIEQVREQIQRPVIHTLPTINIARTITSIDDFVYEDIELVNYTSYGKLDAKMVA